MREKYSFLKDEFALNEIRKHKWIESEKAGQEIGFATAAVDWIKKYGAAWRESRKTFEAADILSEKRRYRRFFQQLPMELNINNRNIRTLTLNINEIGAACDVPEFIPRDTETRVRILFPLEKGKSHLRFQFNTRIVRISKITGKRPSTGYNVFLPFNEEVRHFLRMNTDILKN